MCHAYRIILIVLLVIIVNSGSAFAKFQDVLDTPAEMTKLADKNLYNGVTVAGNRIICVGQYGNIVYSDDKAKTWIQAKVPVSSDLVAVHFPSSLKGWAVGHDGIVIHSKDGGMTWEKQLDGRMVAAIMNKYYSEHPPKNNTRDDDAGQQFRSEMENYVKDGPDKPFLDVFFENEARGFVVGAYNMIFFTEDSGKTWIPWYDRTDNPKRLHMYSINNVDGDIYIVGETGIIMKLDRRAMIFRELKKPYEGTLFGVTGKKGILIVYGMRGNLFLSTDKGVSWKKISTEIEAGLISATVTREGHIIIVSQGGDVLCGKSDFTKYNFVKYNLPNVFPTAVSAIGNDTILIAGFTGLRDIKLK